MREKGLVHIYCGDGKGKTTAAMGAAVRAAGRGWRVLIARFLKTEDSGEVAGLSGIPGVTLIPCGRSFGFSWDMSGEQKQEARAYYTRYFIRAWETAAGPDGGSAEGGSADGGGVDAAGPDGGGPCDMLVLDEAVAACNLGFLDEARLIRALEARPSHLEVIITGRGPSEALMAQADYITEMVMRRHPYEKGIGAREGIEY